jgi:hypothetical protein
MRKVSCTTAQGTILFSHPQKSKSINAEQLSFRRKMGLCFGGSVGPHLLATVSVNLSVLPAEKMGMRLLVVLL